MLILVEGKKNVFVSLQVVFMMMKSDSLPSTQVLKVDRVAAVMLDTRGG